MADDKGKSAAAEEASGEVVVCGATDWGAIGRANKKDDSRPNLPVPHRLGGALSGVRVTAVCAGPAASHCVAVAADGRAFSWGRNECGQLGLGDTRQRQGPALVLLPGAAASASCGRSHTLFAMADGSALACGSNKQGQLGVGKLPAAPRKGAPKGAAPPDEDLLAPARCAGLPDTCTAVAAGAEFSLWLCGGHVYSAGMPQYGQLGHGTDHEYNARDGSVKLQYEPQPSPKRIVGGGLAGKEVAAVAAGHNHSLALDTEGKLYTWGFGGYGRLGHKVQKDEMSPTQVAVMGGDRNACPAGAAVAAGGTSTWAVCGPAPGMLFYWGKTKVTGDSQMYPVPFMELEGWGVRSMACGGATFCVAAERSCITWGQAAHQELGYGDKGPKSSANPKKCDTLEGMTTLKVAAGMGHMLFLVDPASPGYDKLPVYEPEEDEGGAAGKRKDAPKGAPAAKAAKAAKAAPKAKKKK